MTRPKKQRKLSKGATEIDLETEKHHRELVVAEIGAESDSENYDDESEDDDAEDSSENEFEDVHSDEEMPDADGLPSMAARGEKMGRKALLLKAGAASGSTKATGALRERRQVDRASGDLGKPQNKQRVLLLSSRGITYRYRHLLNDLHALLPHSKKESKFEQKTELYALNEVAELANCNNAIFLECRRHTDLYLWMAKTPNGPSVKFFVQNVHTMDELRLTGNCLKGSRPIVSFDKNFDSAPHLSLLKEMFTQIFATPRTSRKIKPFVDHVLNFSVVDNKIWFRNYQVVEKAPPIAPGQEPISLVEIGPRFVLDIVRIFDGSFCGATLYENPTFVTPAQVRRAMNAKAGHRYASRKSAEELRSEKLAAVVGIGDDQEELREVFS